MAKRMIGNLMGALALCAASMAWAGSANPSAPAAFPVKVAAVSPAKAKSKVQAPAGPSLGNPSASGTLQGTEAPSAEAAPKPILAEAFIAQSALRVYLNRPASVSVYNSRGQQVFHVESQRSLETVPLQGITTGFIYLTARTAQGEMTKKLVYTGK
jgi:hypothetical protein